MNNSPRILVSIVNWNNSAAANRCLEGIGRLPKDKQPDVVVIDNDSTLDAFKIDPGIKESLRRLSVVINKENLGFAGGHNPSIKKAKEEDYDYVILLNPDTEIIDSDLFDKLAAALEDNPKALAANPTILSAQSPDIIWYGGGRLSLKSGSASHMRVGADKPPHGIEKVSFLTGCCLAISMKHADLAQLLLNEDYFLYWEDADWCARAAKAGFELLYVPQAMLLHHVSDSLGVRSPAYIYYNIRNHFLFIQRNVTVFYRPLGWLSVGYITLKYMLNILVRYKNDRLKAFKTLWFGWVDGLSNKNGRLRRAL